MDNRGTTVLLLTAIFMTKFFRAGGFSNLWGAITGELVVK